MSKYQGRNRQRGDIAMIPSRVADLTVDQFKDLIHEVVTQTIVEMFGDPDAGLDLREDIKANLQRSLAAVQAGGETIPAEVVAANFAERRSDSANPA
jgi:hypothetical protein